MIVVSRGNHHKQTFTLQDDTTVNGGMWIGCNVVLNGFTLSIQSGGYYDGIQIDSVRLDPGSPPAGVTIGAGVSLPGSYNLLTTLTKAINIRRTIFRRSGDEGLTIYDRALDEIYADPDITKAELYTAVDAWADTDPGGDEAHTNTLNIERAFDRLSAKFFPATSYANIKTEMLAEDRATWNGERTVIDEVL